MIGVSTMWRVRRRRVVWGAGEVCEEHRSFAPALMGCKGASGSRVVHEGNRFSHRRCALWSRGK